MQKKIILMVLILCLIPLASSETTMHELTKGYADTLYCQQSNGCVGTSSASNNLTVNNCIFDKNSNSSICFLDGHVQTVVDIG